MPRRFASLVVAFVALGAAFIFWFSSVARFGETAPGGTSMVVLVDFSESYSPLHAVDKNALTRIADTIAQLTKSERVPKPVVVLFLGIGNTSLIAESPCGVPIEYEPKLTGRARPGLVTRLAQLHLRLDECVKAVVQRSHKPEKYTDISGAIAAAAESSRTGFSRRIVFVVSDFFEDRPPGASEVQYQLSGQQFALVYRPESRDASNQNLVLQRLAAWERRLTERGAGSVCRIFAPSISKDTLLRCLGEQGT